MNPGSFKGRPSAGYPYPLGLAIFLVQVATGIILFAVFQQYVPHHLGTNDAWPGYLLTAYGGARFLSETPTGAISDRVERKLGMLVGFVLMIPAITAIATVDHKLAYVACSAFFGFGSAFLWPAAYAVSADLYPAERRGKVIGFLNLAQLLGFGVGALVGAFMVEGAPAGLFVVAVGGVVAAFVAASVGIPSYRAGRLFARVVHESRPALWSILSVQLVALSALILASSAAMAIMVPAIRPFGDQQLHVSFATLTVALIPSVVIGAALYMPAGHLSDRFGRVGPFFVGQLLVGAGALAVASAHSLVWAGMGAVVVFAGNVVSVPAWNAAIMDLAPATHRGTLIGLSVALSGLGLALGPTVGGLVVHAYGPAAAFRLAAAVCVVTSVAVVVYGRLYRERRLVPVASRPAG